MLEARNLLTPQALGCALGVLATASCVYGLVLATYRLFFSPLSKFPGPKLAAISFFYEFYYDVILGGQYIFKIARLHEEYGPVIRINPHEIHVDTPEFYDVLYTGPAHRRHKWHWSMRGFGADTSTFGTPAHDAHRMRKAALNQFFSMGQVRRLEPAIRDVVDAFMRRVDGFREDGQVFRLDIASSALTADIITQYAFGRRSRSVELPDFNMAFHETLIDTGRQFFLTRQFPIVMKIVQMVPSSLILRLYPSLTSFYNLQRSISMQVSQVIKEPTGEKLPTDGRKTIFRDILDSKLPPSEKTIGRLAREGGIIISAGTTTTAWTITVLIYHLLSEPGYLTKFKQELLTIKDVPQDSLSAAMESLPLFNAMIQEGLRLSHGVVSRLTRIAPDEDLIVPATDKSKEWRIPANTPISMTQLDMMRNKEVFPSPEKFRPERWIEEPGLSKYQVAFGKGTRQCLGKNLAIVEICLVFAALFSKYGSKDVKMEGDVGYLELFETDESDIICAADAFLPLTKKDSKGVRIRVHKW